MTVQEVQPATAAEPQWPTPQQSAPPPTSTLALGLTRPQRLVSLDVFRGITIAAMLLVNNPGKGRTFGPLRHADWNGWTMTDLIFPFFLFIVGVAIPFSMSKRAMTAGKLQLLGGIWMRALSIVLCGALLHALPLSSMDPVPDGYGMLRILRWIALIFTLLGLFAVFFPWKRSRYWNWILPAIGVTLVLLLVAIHFYNKHALAAGIGNSFRFGGGMMTPYTYRIPGVLQRIGICYGIAATIALVAGWRMVLVSAIILMAAYSALMLKAPFENHEVGSLTQKDNLARRIDEKVFRNHVYGQYPDPEGLLSTLPAIGSVLLGILCGHWLRTQRNPIEKAAGLLAMGVLVTIIGVLLDWWLMPINKQIWTPSFTVFTAGMAMLGLGTVFYVADVRGHRRWALPFKIYGVNAIAAFVLAGILGRVSARIVFKHPQTGADTDPLAFARGEVADGMHHTAAWLAQHLGPAWQALDAPNNVSLAQAIAFVLIVFLAMSVLYVCKIFIKV
jgi:predicted acyltransferase